MSDRKDKSFHDVVLHVEGDCSTHAKLDEIIRLLFLVIRKENQMAGELDALTAQVARNTDVDQSAIVLLNGIKAKLDEAIRSGNPAALTALSTSLGSSTDALAAAVVANTDAGNPTDPNNPPVDPNNPPAFGRRG